MLVLPQFVEVELRGRDIAWYKNLGYPFNKMGDKIIIPVEHLQKGSQVLVEYLCDYCLENGSETKLNAKFNDYNNQRKKFPKDCCDNCTPLKIRDKTIQKHGVDHISKLPEVQEKRLQTFANKTEEEKQEVLNKRIKTTLDRYGVEHSSQSEEIKEKIYQTNIERYGVKSYTQTEEYAIRNKEICLEKYGVEHTGMLPEVQEKVKKTTKERYGVEFAAQSPIIQEKILKTKYINGTQNSSRPQLYLNKLYNGVMNYSENMKVSLDVAFPEEMIYLEYDGGGHWLSVTTGKITMEEFNKKEMRRSYALIGEGWKEIRIISRNDLLPSNEKLLEMMSIAKDYLNTGRHFIKFDIDESKIITSQYKKNFDFSKLRKIKDEDLLNQEANMNQASFSF